MLLFILFSLIYYRSISVQWSSSFIYFHLTPFGPFVQSSCWVPHHAAPKGGTGLCGCLGQRALTQNVSKNAIILDRIILLKSMVYVRKAPYPNIQSCIKQSFALFCIIYYSHDFFAALVLCHESSESRACHVLPWHSSKPLPAPCPLPSWHEVCDYSCFLRPSWFAAEVVKSVSHSFPRILHAFWGNNTWWPLNYLHGRPFGSAKAFWFVPNSLSSCSSMVTEYSTVVLGTPFHFQTHQKPTR